MPDPTPRVKELTPDDVKALLASARPGEVTLLDVRQGWEYAEDHIPQALHIPLPELPERQGELPPGRPLVVYCASGKRSQAAAALLMGQGVENVRNMRGGLGAWTGATAVGDAGEGLDALAPGRSARDVLGRALTLEDNLGRFYAAMARRVGDAELAAVFTRLAGFEDKHKVMVRHIFSTLFPGETPPFSGLAQDILEGGRPAGRVLDETPGLREPFDVLEMAMGLEAQALDLYTRLGREETDPRAGSALAALAREEHGHLKALGNLMDRLG